MACGSAAGEQQEAIRLARLEEAKRYLDLHLADSDLTPEKAAGDNAAERARTLLI